MSQSDIELVRRIPVEVMMQHKFDVIDEIFSPAFVEHSPFPGVLPGPEGLRTFLTSYTTAFPDLSYDLVHEVSQGDLVIQHVEGSGTMEGDFMGMPAAHKKACWTEIHVVRVEGGKIVEHWGVVDQAAILGQLGFIETPGMEQAA